MLRRALGALILVPYALAGQRSTPQDWLLARITTPARDFVNEAGNEVTLTAPAAGYVRNTVGKKFPLPGDPVDPEKEILLIEPVLSPAEKIQGGPPAQ